MEWIKSQKQLPKPHEIVAFIYNNEVHIGYFLQKSKHSEYLWQSHIDGYNCVVNVSLWMPLPPIPESQS